MDEQRKRIIEDLSGLLQGEIRCDPLTVALYSTDGSLYQIEPLGVAFPKDRNDVSILARYSSETDIPLIPRGAGSQVAGGALGSGIVVDFSKHMKTIESVGENLVEVESGVFLDQLNAALRPYRRYFPPDPSNASVTTIGGMLGVDAAGSRSLRVGSTRDHVRSIEMVVADGPCLEFGVESLDILKTSARRHRIGGHLTESGDEDESVRFAVKREIISKLVQLLGGNSDLIHRHQTASLVRNCSGYALRGILTDTHLRLPQMLVGSEGTLGLFTRATLHTAPLPEHRGIVLLLFGQLETAIQAVHTIATVQPSACDLLDRRLITLGRESDPRFAKLIDKRTEALLIVEQTGFSTEQARERIRMVVQRVRELSHAVVVAYEGYTFDEVEFLWSLSRGVVPLLARLPGKSRPLPIIEDIAVPPDATQEFLRRVQKVLQKHRVTASLYAHAAAGQIHLRPFLPVPRPADTELFERLAHDVYQVVFSVGGTISGEHGDGLARTAFIRSQYGPLYKLFQQIKDIFDPHNLMNPGKILSDDPHLTVRNLRPSLQASEQPVALQLAWSPEALVHEAGLCNGCAVCRTQQPDLRMCPFFRLEPAEKASPRAKANLMRQFACGTLDMTDMGSPAMKRLADLCFNCKQCQIECPSGVNIPQLMIEAKAAHVVANGLGRTEWLLSRAHALAAIGCLLPFLSNWAIRDPALRWLLEKCIGIHRDRKLPSFARRTFLRSLRNKPQHRSLRIKGQPPIVYFVDEYANFHDPELGQAFLAVLQHNEIPVYVPPGQLVSGMSLVTVGDVSAARRIAETNVRELVELAREGASIVCTEPSATLCLKYEYPMLLDHPDVQVVADRVIEAGAFLQEQQDKGKLRTDFDRLDLDAAYHLPCHLKALGKGTPFCDLLRLIPGLRVHTIEKGCSGMAGVFGLMQESFETSIRIGKDLIEEMQSETYQIGTTECSRCKVQMEQQTTIPTVHPLKLLALAYGLMPELHRKLKPSKQRLVVT